MWMKPSILWINNGLKPYNSLSINMKHHFVENQLDCVFFSSTTGLWRLEQHTNRQKATTTKKMIGWTPMFLLVFTGPAKAFFGWFDAYFKKRCAECLVIALIETKWFKIQAFMPYKGKNAKDIDRIWCTWNTFYDSCDNALKMMCSQKEFSSRNWIGKKKQQLLRESTRKPRWRSVQTRNPAENVSSFSLTIVILSKGHEASFADVPQKL